MKFREIIDVIQGSLLKINSTKDKSKKISLIVNLVASIDLIKTDYPLTKDQKKVLDGIIGVLASEYKLLKEPDDLSMEDLDKALDEALTMEELDDELEKALETPQKKTSPKSKGGRKTNTNWLYDINITDKDRDKLISWFTGNVLQIFVGAPTFFRIEKNVKGANSSNISPTKIDKNQDNVMVFIRLKNKTGNPISFEAYLEGDGVVFRKRTKRTSTKGRKPVYNEKIFETKKAFDLALKKALLEY